MRQNQRRPAVRDTGSFKPVGGSALSSESHPSSSLTNISEMRMPGYPATCVRRLRYATTVSITSTTGVPAGYIFRANDLFDPDFTSTGHQPEPFDQLMVAYNHFTVFKSKCTVTFRNASAACVVAVRQDADNTVITNADQIMEMGGVVSENVEVKGTYGNAKTISLGLNIPKLWGMSRKQHLADSTQRGSASASPSEVTYYHLMAWDPGATTTTVTGYVVIDYLATFTEPRTQTESLKLRMAWESFKASRPESDWHTMNMAAAVSAYEDARARVRAVTDLKDTVGERCVRQDGLLVPAEPPLCSGRRHIDGLSLNTDRDYLVVNPDPAVLQTARRVRQ
jgi:hypothetical protein